MKPAIASARCREEPPYVQIRDAGVGPPLVVQYPGSHGRSRHPRTMQSPLPHALDMDGKSPLRTTHRCGRCLYLCPRKVVENTPSHAALHTMPTLAPARQTDQLGPPFGRAPQPARGASARTPRDGHGQASAFTADGWRRVPPAAGYCVGGQCASERREWLTHCACRA